MILTVIGWVVAIILCAVFINLMIAMTYETMYEACDDKRVSIILATIIGILFLVIIVGFMYMNVKGL